MEPLLEFEPAAAGLFERPAVAVVAAAGASSMIDRRIGPYTIVSPLGAGGMGEVYRARDSKLGRDVAIKILPAHFTADTERRARFAREARTLATLNHPHIGAIYGLEEADGIHALVLGQSLVNQVASRKIVPHVDELYRAGSGAGRARRRRGRAGAVSLSRLIGVRLRSYSRRRASRVDVHGTRSATPDL